MAPADSPSRVEACHFLFELVQCRGLRFDLGAGARWQLHIVLMEAGLRTLHRVVSEQYVIEKTIRECGELAIAFLRDAHSGEQNDQENQRNPHKVDYTGVCSFTFDPVTPSSRLSHSDTVISGVPCSS